MQHLITWLFALAFAALCSVTVKPVHAAMTIHICGDYRTPAGYNCSGPVAPEASFGQVGGILITDSDGKSVHVPVGTGTQGHQPEGWSSPTSPPSTAGAPTTQYAIGA